MATESLRLPVAAGSLVWFSLEPAGLGVWSG